MAVTSAPAAIRGCYRVDALSGSDGIWGDAKLPLVISMDSVGGVARVLTTGGEDTKARAIVTRSDADSLSFQLRRIGFTGSMALGGAGPTRRGFARSLKADESEHAVTVTVRAAACP
jgi:hypothetical protein